MTDHPTPSLVIRAARRDDVPHIVRLLVDDALGATRDALTDPLPKEYFDAFDAICAHPDNELLVAELQGRVVGCLQLTIIPGLSRRGALRAQVEGVRVESALRSAGIGRALMDAAIARARARGCVIMQLTSDASRVRAHAFYERLGFVASHVGMKRSLLE